MERPDRAFALVEAKLHPPAPNPAMVPRARVRATLLAEPRPPVILVAAPPGYGKTVALAEWASAEDRPVAWLVLDQFDNEPGVFLAYVAAAIERIGPLDPAVHAAIAGPQSRLLAAAVPRLANELHRIGRPAALVLDDAHRLVEHACLDALSVLLDHLPLGFQVVLAARTPPALPFGRLRAQRALLEIGPRELALDAAEAEALAASVGCSLDVDEVRKLIDRTEGWAAGVYLASLAFVRGQASSGKPSIVVGRDSYIADYFRGELLLNPAPDEVQFLTRTSILEVVDPHVAEAVTELPDAAARLRSLARTNPFISEVEGGRGSYRYHNLVREFLAAELERREPDEIARLHRRAAVEYQANGLTDQAIEHLLLGDDSDAAAALVASVTLSTLFGGHGDRVDRWLRSFDRAAFAARPPLAVIGAWLHALHGRPEQADSLADLLEGASFDGDPGDGSASFESGRAMIRCAMGRRGPEDMLANARFAVSSESIGSPWRSVAHAMLGSALEVCDDAPGADAAFREAIEAGAVAGAPVALASRARLAMTRGDWREAERFAHESHAVMTRAGVGDMAISLMVHAVSARVAIRHGDLRRGREHLVRAQVIRPLATYATPWLAVSARLEIARAYLSLSDHAGARNAVAEAEAVVRRRPALGVLNRELEELRARLRDVSTSLAGSSALTPAELRLLPILSTPLTFKEIGDRLFLSRHTVKTEAISIYGKLQASSRSEAVQRAIELGLLEPFPGLPRAGGPPPE